MKKIIKQHDIIKVISREEIKNCNLDIVKGYLDQAIKEILQVQLSQGNTDIEIIITINEGDLRSEND